MLEFLRNEDAPTFTEYALLISLIAVIVAAGAALFGTGVGDMFTKINNDWP